MNLNDAVTCLWLTKSHWANFTVMTGEKQALQAGAWLDVLSDIELSDVRSALATLDTDGQDFPPTPGQVRHAVLASQGLAAPDADQAYSEMLGFIHSHGMHTYGKSVLWSHPAIPEAVQAMGGWETVCMATHTDAFRAQFRNAYEAAAKRADREAMMPPIVRQLSRRAADALALPPPDDEDVA